MDRIATMEVKNVPAGAILLASVSQALGVVGAGLLVSKWPGMDKYANPVIGGAGAVLIPQLKGFIGENGSKALAIGSGTQAIGPYIGKGINALVSAVTPAPAAVARRPAVPATTPARPPTTYRAPAGAATEADLAASASAGIESR